MSWFVLVISGALEAVWATALARSEAFHRLAPTAVFFVAMSASMGGLAFAITNVARHPWPGEGAPTRAPQGCQVPGVWRPAPRS